MLSGCWSGIHSKSLSGSVTKPDPDPYLNRVKVQCDAIWWEQLENWHFSRGYITLKTNDLILILKIPTRPFSCLANVWIVQKV